MTPGLNRCPVRHHRLPDPAIDLARQSTRRQRRRSAAPSARSTHHSSPAPGFTLIEVLVALTIVAITLGAGIRAAGALTDNTQRLTDVGAAEWCADNQLAALRLSGLTPPIGDSDFPCTQLGQTYRGKLVVRPAPNPLFVNVDAQIADEPGRPILSLRTVLRK